MSTTFSCSASSSLETFGLVRRFCRRCYPFNCKVSQHYASLIIAIISSMMTMTKPSRLATRLIHRNSYLHPLYDPNETVEDRSKREETSSIERFAYLESKIKELKSVGNVARSNLSPFNRGSGFLVNLSIGSPPVAQLVVIDTGSSLLWVQCLPCINCFRQSSSWFDPLKSSSFKILGCGFPGYNYVSGYRCNGYNQAEYKLRYLGGDTSQGLLAKESLLFETSDEGKIRKANLTFGCGHMNFKTNIDDSYNGVFGLGAYPYITMATQLGNKFSYCIGDINDPLYTHNQLVLGEGAYVEGDSTPLEIHFGHYYVNLEGISVGTKRLNIDPKAFQMTWDGRGGVLIDSGMTYTKLANGGFELLYDEILDLANGLLERIPTRRQFEGLCFKGVVSRDLIGLPPVTFHFAGGADLVLESGSLFRQHGGDRFCLAILPSNSEMLNLSVIGILAQQNYNVAFDLEQMKVFFSRIDCQLLDD
ncbi:aspartic proteinase CDR1-like isoform X1 [Cucurbita pepo subsp. pepo]|uniref:aspartic proteinase CDR1-like isoform X1 n=2 Tax=Cucurbita pepo subsp. pepo TaxID=3664 RepID=UPI000C9D93E0|nr:aspartic proteinase CDR1-like isoform X1 [Cucurbita pepo subsp. pepo]